MGKGTREELFAVESRLNRSFWACAVTLVLLLIGIYVTLRTESAGARVATMVVLLMMLRAYVWYATAAGAAARALGQEAWKYVTWTLAAPVLSLLPIPVVSMLIPASPPATHFLLGG